MANAREGSMQEHDRVRAWISVLVVLLGFMACRHHTDCLLVAAGGIVYRRKVEHSKMVVDCRDTITKYPAIIY